MKLIEWTEEFSLNLDGIDSQHKSLFEIINRVWRSIIENASQEEILQRLGELEHYTAVHFTAEEAFMQSVHYPHRATHEQEHRDFIARIADERDAVLAGRPLRLELVHFLQVWLINHIKVSDKAYATFTISQKSGHSIGSFFKRFW